MQTECKLSERLREWLDRAGPRTLGSLVDLFGPGSFAVLFVLLMAFPALPLPTGGITHVFELIAMLLALELMAGRREIWLPERWRRIDLGTVAEGRFADVLLRRIRWLERFSRPRLGFLLTHRLSGVLYGAIVFALALTAFVAPPFTGLDTLPAMGVVVLSLGVLLEDSLLALAGVLVGAFGVFVVIGLGGLVVDEIGRLL